MRSIVVETTGKVQTISYTLKRRKGKRGITIRIKADGEICVSASLSEPVSNIEFFLRQKQAWIQEYVARMQARPQLPPHTWRDGDILLLFGQRYVLRIEQGLLLGRKTVSIIINAGQIIVMTSLEDINPKQVHDAVIGFYRSQALAYLSEEIPRRASLMELPTPPCSVINCTSRWGSCSSQKKLSFAVRIATLPPRLIEYLVLHELSHMVYFNHGAEFKRLLTSQMPDWRIRQRELYDHQALSDLRFEKA
jgi:predicted metal-dependent hydrolase